MTAPLQPFLHNELVVLRAPTQVWSADDGSIGAAAIHGIAHSDVRVVRGLRMTVGGQRLHGFVQRVLPGVAERCMTQVVRQGDRFDQVLVELQGAGNAAPELRHFDRVCEARA